MDAVGGCGVVIGHQKAAGGLEGLVEPCDLLNKRLTRPRSPHHLLLQVKGPDDRREGVAEALAVQGRSAVEAVAQRFEHPDLALEPEPLERTLPLQRLQKLGTAGEHIVKTGRGPVGQQGVEGPQGRRLHPHRQVVGDPAEQGGTEGGHRTGALGAQARGNLPTGGIDAALEIDQLTFLKLTEAGRLDNGPLGLESGDDMGLGHQTAGVGGAGGHGVEQAPLHRAIKVGQAAGPRGCLAEGGFEELAHPAEQLVDGVGGLLLQAGIEGLQCRSLHIGGEHPLQASERALPEIGDRIGTLARKPVAQHATGVIDVLLQCRHLGMVEPTLAGGIQQELLGGVGHADVDERGLRSRRMAFDALLDRAEHVELTLGGELRENALRHVHLRVSEHTGTDARGTL